MREEDEGVECSVVSGHQEDWREWVILGWGVASISIQWPLLLLLLPSMVDKLEAGTTTTPHNSTQQWILQKDGDDDDGYSNCKVSNEIPLLTTV